MPTKDQKTTSNQNYGADQIQVLEGLEPVRKRPGMYIGSTGQTGLHHLVTEIVNNSMDEAIAGFADFVKVAFLADGSVVIYDNGRGIPFDIKKGYGVSALELAFTKLHAGGKFGGGSYKVSSGLHGVGASVVNALSSWCRVVVKRGNSYVLQEYEHGGKVVGPVHPLDPKSPKSELKKVAWGIDLADIRGDSGTAVQFMPDSTIFETVDFKTPFFKNQLKEYAFLTPKIKFELADQRVDQTFSYFFEGGIKSYIISLNKLKKPIHETVFYVNKTVDEIQVEAALMYNDSFTESVLTFANHIKNPEGGTHLTGFKAALTRSINDYSRKSNLLKDKDPNFSGDDLLEGLTAIISVKLDSEVLQFEGQTKEKLGNSSVRPAVESVVKEGLEIFFEEHPRDAQDIITKNILALKARMAAKAARDTVIRKSALEGGGVLPGKLADCSSKDTDMTEVFIVEGDSAGGTAKGARNREYQAILPLFGKPLNTEKSRIDKVVEDVKIKQLVIALGTGIGESLNASKLRYGKVIVMSDADVDGYHIQTLYLTLFYRHMPQLIADGKIFMAVPPLYKATWGKEKKYITSEAELEAFSKSPQGQKAQIQRFKGLGEMNPEELWETTMNPQTRNLKQITISDAEKAEETFTTLMGIDVAPRKKFIQTHAKEANIDVT